MVLDAYLSASKMEWLMVNSPQVQAAQERGTLMMGNLDSWMMWRLSGGRIFATDQATASRTLLFNVHTLDWDPDLLDLFGIPRWVLPDPKPCAAEFGWTDPEHCQGLEIPIAASAVDQPAALYGQACYDRGDLKVTYGTGAFMLMNIGPKFTVSRHGLLTSVAAVGPGEETRYYLDGAIYSVGAAVEWLQKNLGLIDDPAATAEAARSLESNDGVYFVPALVGLAAPHWERKTQAGFFGLTRGSTAAHLVRAVLEAVAYRVLEVAEVMGEDAGLEIREIKVDGGVSRNDFLMQFQADLLGLPLVRLAGSEMTALGVAHLAGLQTGFWPDKSAFPDRADTARRYEPGPGRGPLKNQIRALEKSGGPGPGIRARLISGGPLAPMADRWAASRPPLLASWAGRPGAFDFPAPIVMMASIFSPWSSAGTRGRETGKQET